MSRDAIDDAAIWLAAQDKDDFDWDGFTAWLEADPRHRVAYDDLILLEDQIAVHRRALAGHETPPRAVGIRAPARRGWMAAAAGGAVAAALAVGVAGYRPGAADDVWRSGDTAVAVALGDGVDVRLAPHSVMTARHGDHTRLAVDGTAYFEVRHDPARSLTVTAGPIVARDIGTRFEMTGAQGIGRIAIAEGSLTVAAKGMEGDVRLGSGASLSDVDGQVDRGSVDPATIGGWRHGMLVYDRTPIALVAADIERYSGQRVTIDPLLATTRFSGVLTIGDGSRLAGTVASILGIEAKRGDGGVRLEPRR